MNSRGYSLLELMVTIAILGTLGVAMSNTFAGSADAEQEAYRLLSKTQRLVAASKSYYQSSCNVPDFQLTLNELKQKGRISNDFNYPAHNLSITNTGTPRAYLHVEISLKPAVAAHFVGLFSKARSISNDTVVVSTPVATAVSSDRQRLVAMKTLWGEGLC